MSNPTAPLIELVNGGGMKRLQEIRREFEIRYSTVLTFPMNLCREMSGRVESEMGLPKVLGFFKVDGGLLVHAWNTTKSGGIIDISGDQFNRDIPSVYVAHIDPRYHL
jgi:hypothetical protein